MSQLIAEVRQQRHGVHLEMRRETANIAEFCHSDVGLRRREEASLRGRERALQREEDVLFPRSRRLDLQSAQRSNHFVDFVDPDEVKLYRGWDFPKRVDADDEFFDVIPVLDEAVELKIMVLEQAVEIFT